MYYLEKKSSNKKKWQVNANIRKSKPNFKKTNPVVQTELLYLSIFKSSINLAKKAFEDRKYETSINYLIALIPLCQLALDMKNLLATFQCVA